MREVKKKADNFIYANRACHQYKELGLAKGKFKNLLTKSLRKQ
jgi:hypothetical protein